MGTVMFTLVRWADTAAHRLRVARVLPFCWLLDRYLGCLPPRQHGALSRWKGIPPGCRICRLAYWALPYRVAYFVLRRTKHNAVVPNRKDPS